MNPKALFSAMLLPALAGCVSVTTPMGYTNTAVADAKQGEDCRTLIGLGGMLDLTGIAAMRQGSITKLRSTEYREHTFYGTGKACIVAHGE